jgi:hypothetical protein
VIEHGPGTEGRFKPGTRVISMPFMVTGTGLELVGYSNTMPGGFAQNMLLNENMLIEVPNGLATDLAALTEPFAVGAHAAAAAALEPGSPCLVLGCGPVGLAVIASLKAKAFSMVKDRMTMHVAGEDDWSLTGSFIEKNYSIDRGGEHIVQITQKWVTIRDTYTVDVRDGVDPALALAIVWAVDRWVEKD